MTPREVAQRFSFPELFMTLRRDDKRRRDDLRVLAVSQFRAALAPWNQDNIKRATDFIQSLADPKVVSKEESANQLVRMFGNAGIPIKEV